MKIRYFSDLHLEFAPPPPVLSESIGEDVVVLAGDIDTGAHGVAWAKDAFADRRVIYVLGNHEYYNGHWTETLIECRKMAANSNVHLLENDTVLIDGVRFLGCTLWTDFRAWGDGKAFDSMQAAGRGIADFRVIGKGALWAKQPLRVDDTIKRHHESCSWLQHAIQSSTEPVVVVTHHGPSLAGCDQKYWGDLFTPAFLNNRDDLIVPPVRAWIFGHTHYSCKRLINGIDLLSNQLGYHTESLEFDPYAMIEVLP